MASNLWSEEQFSCPVCLEILKDPITTACGHSYCMGCIKNCWDQTDHTGVYSCPQCRETFTPRPVLRRNTMLAEVVEKFKKTGINPPPVQSYAGPSDVSCDVCTGRNFKAVKSCLTCLASYCEIHIKPHYEAAALKRHKLVNATGNLEQKLCAEHQKVLEVFCRTDQTCICFLCADKKHKPHDTVSAETERAGKQTQLGEKQREIQQKIQERLRELKLLKQALESIKRSARKEIKESKKIFNELIRSIEKIRSEVTELIGANEKAAVNQAEGFMKKLEQEIAELRRRNAELKQLSETEDHIHFLQNFKSLCAPLEAGDLPSIIANSDISFGAVRKAVSELKDHIEDFCKGELVKISVNETTFYTLRPVSSDIVINVDEFGAHSLQAAESRTRAEFLKYSCQLTLDPNTANKYLWLSEGNRKVTCKEETQSYPDHPDRFDYWEQVLCREGLSGTRCYWEIEYSLVGTCIGVTYKGISTKARDGSCGLGNNDKSWGLYCFGSSYTARHSSNDIIKFGPDCHRIGVYLDFNAGTLSFYIVSSDKITLLHRFQTTFTEPLYPGFYLPFYNPSADDNSVSLVSPNLFCAEDIRGMS